MTFNEAKTSCLGPGCDYSPGIYTEYRRNNWQYSPVLGDIRNGVVDVPQAWGDYEGKTPPWKIVPQVCGMSSP
ncbi:hypothetical protein AG0111_0g10120 [Alternaria gaisen]|uniref:Uncharacterized protein n=1 Tax=Alternaria gaisen TaxID=167740 RepID=A0ACB6FAD0_9PLEO|nr:hypothetical protein AG0111_0g10120 [Alternaria gaisen]